MVYTFESIRFNLIKSIIFISLTLSCALNEDASQLLQKIDLNGTTNVNSHKLSLNLNIVPDSGQDGSNPFYLKVHASVWLTDDEYDDVNAYVSNDKDVDIFKSLQSKLFKRYLYNEFPRDSVDYKYLSMLVCSAIQGNINILNNNIIDHSNPSLEVLTKYPTKHKSQEWLLAQSTLPDLSLEVVNGNAPEPHGTVVNAGISYNQNYYENIIYNYFKESKVGNVTSKATPVETNETTSPASSEASPPETPTNGTEESQDNKNLAGETGNIAEDTSNTTGEANETSGVKGGDGYTKGLSGDSSDEDTDSQAYDSSSTSDGSLSDTSNTVDDQKSTDDEGTVQHSPTPTLALPSDDEEYDETKLLDRFEELDGDGVSVEELTPVTLELFTTSVGPGNRNSVIIDVTTVLHVPESVFEHCKPDELTKECGEQIRQRLLKRFEDDVSKPFKWGRFVSLLEALIFQSQIHVIEYKMEKGTPSVIRVLRPYFVVVANVVYYLGKLEGDVRSTSGKTVLTYKILDKQIEIPNDNKPTNLGLVLSVSIHLNKFFAIYGNYRVTHTKQDGEFSESTKEESESKRVEEKPNISVDAQVSKSTTESGESLDDLMESTPDTKNLNNDIHFILSGYERALSNVPKSLSGYKLSWDSIAAYPDLQRLWKVALDMMNLLKRDGDLKGFLDTFTFSYTQIRDLFDITYGLIASDNYEAAREFYESVGITEKEVGTNLSMVKNLFFAKTGTSITRVPPILKEMSGSCPVKSMITSLSTHDLVERLQLMFGLWLSEFPNAKDSFELAVLCSASAVLLQQWSYFQLDQGFHEPKTPWIDLVTSFSRLARGKYKDKARKKQLKELVNSDVGKTCRKYINTAGVVSATPYKGAGRDYPAKSLVGAIGNALDQNMEASPNEIVISMKNYFREAASNNKVGNALGICLGLQLLSKMNTCFSVENSSDYSLFMLGLLTFDTRNILEAFQNIQQQSVDANSPKMDFVYNACHTNNDVVEKVLNKLIVLLSTESHHLLMEELVRRQYVPPEVDEKGEFVESEADHGESPSESDNYLEDENDFVDLDDASWNKNSESFIELSSSIDDHAQKGIEKQFKTLEGSNFDIDVYEHSPHHYPHHPHPDHPHHLSSTSLVGLPDVKFLDGVYKKLLDGVGVLDPEDFNTVVFDIRIDPLGEDGALKSINVPMSFHKKEVQFLKLLKAKDLLHLFLYRLDKRMEDLKKEIPTDKLREKIQSVSKHNKDADVAVKVTDHIVHCNNDLVTYKNLNHVLSSLPEDGFYFEKIDGEQIPNHLVGTHTADVLLHKHKLHPFIVLQIIDPVHETDLYDLHLDKHHVKLHDHSFYQRISIQL